MSQRVRSSHSSDTESGPQTHTSKGAEVDESLQLTQPKRLLDRLEHFTWAWYCLTMSTGGIALLLSTSSQPHTFDGLNTIGKVVYIFDICAFVVISSLMTYRFIRWPRCIITSITHPTEGLFVATFFLSLSSIIACIAKYGIPSAGPWLVIAHRVLFWIYFAITFGTAVAHYYLLFTSPLLRIEDMTPAWDLPIFPFMLSGTIAASGSQYQPPYQAVPMLVAGLTAQGLGMMMSILMYASYIRRMIQFGFPSANSRPAMFIAVGPPSFTSLALIGMANDFPRMYIAYFGSQDITSQILRVMATVTALFIWSLSIWFFSIAVLACFAARKQMTFHLNWWAFVFPNVGLTIATIDIGKMFQSQGLVWVGSIMTILLVCVYLCVGACHVRAVWRRDILWDGKDEDVYKKERKLKKEKELQASDIETGVGALGIGIGADDISKDEEKAD